MILSSVQWISPNFLRSPSFKKINKKLFPSTFKDGAKTTVAAASSMSNFYFSFFFLLPHKMDFNKTNTIKRKQSGKYVHCTRWCGSPICCFKERGEARRDREASGRFVSFTSINSGNKKRSSMKGPKKNKIRTNGINRGWGKVSGTSRWGESVR